MLKTPVCSEVNWQWNLSSIILKQPQRNVTIGVGFHTKISCSCKDILCVFNIGNVTSASAANIVRWEKVQRGVYVAEVVMPNRLMGES